MEDGLVHTSVTASEQPMPVLILVVMEDGLVLYLIYWILLYLMS